MFDAYNRRARIAPAILLAVPAGALLVAGAISPDTVLRAVGVFLGAIGILVAIFVRGAGRRIQPQLWKSWGGPPTLTRLRWRTAPSVPAMTRLHERIEAATGETLPDADTEEADPEEADRRYNEAVNVLKERTRTQAFPLVAAENADYGFRRNTLGLRQLGITFSIVGLLVAIAFVGLGSGSLSTREDRWGAAAAVCLVCLLFWLSVVTDAWVRKAADNYADRLLGAADSLRQSVGN